MEDRKGPQTQTNSINRKYYILPVNYFRNSFQKKKNNFRNYQTNLFVSYRAREKMNYTIDLRFLVLPIINILSQFLLSSRPGSGSESESESESDPSINYATDLPILIIMLLFLLTSVQIPLSLSVDIDPIRLKFAEFYLSVLLAFTLFASFFLPPALFSYGYVICFCLFLLAPCSPSLLRRLERQLKRTPTYFITSVGRQRASAAEEIPQLNEIIIYGHA